MSNLSIGGAIRKVIADANITELSERIYRDMGPAEVQYPFVTFFDEITNVPSLLGDSTVKARRRGVQVTLWQSRNQEDVELVDTLVSLLENAPLDANKKVFRCRVSSIERLVNTTDNIVQHAITLIVTQGV
jgi:hypothetical protein